jgi:hypothetical protein
VRRAVRNFVKGHFKRAFEFGQRLGIDVLPRHFYSSIPDFRALRRDDRWRRPYDMAGVAGTDLDVQLELLRSWLAEPVHQRLARGDVWCDACSANGEPGYGPADADVLFAFIHATRPARMIQVGCGVSTAVILSAAREAGHAIRLTCIDPYPTALLRKLAGEGAIDLLPEPAEHVPEARLADLSEGDCLFVDSSHTTKPGSEVHHLIFRVLPRLTSGVWVHFHDINFPYDFGPNLFGPGDLFFGAESTLLHAYLIHNSRCNIALSMSMLHDARRQALSEVLPRYTAVATRRGLNPPGAEGQTPSATWLRTT